jgi:predicted nucleotidyltransferase
MNKMKSILTALVNTITKTEAVEKIILFGSRARGDEEEKSDIDIAIICPNIADKEWFDLYDRIENTATLLEINVIKFDTAGKKLQNKILAEGKVLYERD